MARRLTPCESCASTYGTSAWTISARVRLCAGSPNAYASASARAEHHAIHVPELFGDDLVARDAAIDHDRHVRKVALQAMDVVVLERRHLTIFLRGQALQDGIACVHQERGCAGFGHGADEIAHEAVPFDGVDADPMLHGHRQTDGVADRPYALGDQHRIGHQAGAETSGLDTLGGTTDIEVDLVVAPRFAQPRAMRERLRVAATELEPHRMLGRIEVEMPWHVAEHERAGRDHLGVQVRARADQTKEVPTVTVGPVHHRGHAQSMC